MISKHSTRYPSDEHDLTYHLYGAHALLIQWHPSRELSTTQQICHLMEILTERYSAEIEDIVPGYDSLTIYYDVQLTTVSALIDFIEGHPIESQTLDEEDVIVIDTDYSLIHGMDTTYLSGELDLTPREIVEIHSQPIYDVHFIGFLPGFPYLAGIDERLHISRRSQPRVRVPAGSVAIAGGQTGIYPMESPGGWHIIGHTDTSLFDPHVHPPSLLSLGSKIRFNPIALP